ncbi:DUF3592 domain-containing protein [Archangium gephyra]|uniref:DUF3592 domain-containing protein n=1 Tax=Archangium gephyra TaxID=48 RepID=UPI003B80855F
MYCPLLMGLGLIAFALFAWLQHLYMRHHGILVVAEVVGGTMTKRARGKGAKVKAPRRKDWYGLLVRYQPPDGEAVELGVATRRPMSSFNPGDKVEVLFNPAKPDLAVFPDENVMVGPMLLAGMGLFIVIVFLATT